MRSQNKPKRYVEKKTSLPLCYSVEEIREFLSSTTLNRLPRIHTEKRRHLARQVSIEKCCQLPPAPEQPSITRAPETPSLQLKRQLTSASENGGWTTLRKAQSFKQNSTAVNDLKFQLNLLTDSNFTTVTQIVKICCEQSQDLLITLIDIIVKKAEFETKYHRVYARLCREVGVREKGKAQLIERRLVEAELQDSAVRSRKDFMNRVAFFGQLFLEGVVHRKGLDTMVTSYFHKYLTDTLNNLVYLEGLAMLFQQIGHYELTQPKQQTSDAPQHLCKICKACGAPGTITFNSVFSTFQKIVKTQQDMRVKSLITNLLEKRADRWEERLVENDGQVERRKLQSDTPKKQQPKRQEPTEQRDNRLKKQIISAMKSPDLQKLQSLAQQDQDIFTELFINLFYQHKRSSIDALVTLCLALIDSQTITVDSLASSLKLKFQQITADEADFPFVQEALCKLLGPLIRQGQFDLSEIEDVVASQEEEELLESLRNRLAPLMRES